MKRRSYKAIVRSAAGIVAGLALLMSFQNCGKAGFDAELDGEADLGSASTSLTSKYGSFTGAKVEAVPFAFDAGFDTMTYISCADRQVSNSNAFFTLMAGAYSTGGVRINDDFWKYTDSNFSPVYPATSLSKNQYKNYLADSPQNKGAVPTMSIRVKSSLTDVFAADGKTPTLGQEIIPLIGDLTDSLIMDPIVKKGVSATYFPFSPEQKNMEGVMRFNEDEAQAEEIRNILSSTGSLVLSFMSDPAEAYKVRAPSDAYPVRSAYGKSYNLTFGQANVAGAATNPNHIIAGLIETDLSKPGVSAKTWNCNRRYRIVRTQDIAAQCPAQDYADVRMNENFRNEYNIMRRHLRADQWDINVERRCIVPKGGVSCYKEEMVPAGTSLVEYNLTRECFRTNSSGYTNGPPTSRCLHFATVCIRD